jgi:DNA-binding transcriptional LysR family regulator
VTRASSALPLDARGLVCLAAVAESGTAAAAAEQVGSSASHVSAQLRTLEQKLGRGRLLRRDAHRGELTEAGQALLGYAYPLLQGHLGLLAAADGLRHARAGVLPFGAATDSFHVPERSQLAERFLADNPGARLELTEGSSGDVLRALETGVADIALALLPRARAGYAGYRVLEIRRSAPWLLLPARHRLARREAPVQLAELAGERLAVPPRAADPGFWDRCLAPFAAAGAELAVAPEWSADALIARVARSDELTVLPDWLTPGPRAAGRGIAQVPLDHAIAFDDLCLVARATPDSALTEAFIAAAAAVTGRQPAAAGHCPARPGFQLGPLAGLLHEHALETAQLRALAAVAETRSFTKAATLLFTSQPWLSTQVRTVETRLGLPLFSRTSHRVTVTADGEVLVRAARALLAELDRAAGALSVGPRRPPAPVRAAPLRLGAPTYTLNLPGRERLIQRLAAAPRLLEVRNGYGAQLIAALLQGSLDAAVLLEPLDEPGIVTTGLGDLVIADVMIPDGHPCAARAEVAPADLRGVRLATFRRELNPALYGSFMKPLEDAGAVLVPMNGVLAEGVSEAGAALGLPYLRSSSDRTAPAGYVRRPLATPLRTRLVLAARDERPQPPQLRQLWEMAAQISRELAVLPAAI